MKYLIPIVISLFCGWTCLAELGSPQKDLERAKATLNAEAIVIAKISLPKSPAELMKEGFGVEVLKSFGKDSVPVGTALNIPTGTFEHVTMDTPMVPEKGTALLFLQKDGKTYKLVPQRYSCLQLSDAIDFSSMNSLMEILKAEILGDPSSGGYNAYVLNQALPVPDGGELPLNEKDLSSIANETTRVIHFAKLLKAGSVEAQALGLEWLAKTPKDSGELPGLVTALVSSGVVFPPALVAELMQARDPAVRKWCLVSVGKAAQFNPDNWKSVLDGLADNDEIVAVEACRVLGKFVAKPSVVSKELALQPKNAKDWISAWRQWLKLHPNPEFLTQENLTK